MVRIENMECQQQNRKSLRTIFLTLGSRKGYILLWKKRQQWKSQMIDWRRRSKITQQTGQRKAYSSLKSASSDETVSSGNVKSTRSANTLLFKERCRRTVFCSVHLQRADGKCTKSQALLSMPFPACNSVAVKPELNLSGMVINPFTDNLVLKIELIQKLHEADEKMAKQPKQIKMTPQQFQAFVKIRQNFL